MNAESGDEPETEEKLPLEDEEKQGEISSDSTPVYERHLSNVSVSKIEEADAIEILTTSFEEVVPLITEIFVANSIQVANAETLCVPDGRYCAKCTRVKL